MALEAFEAWLERKTRIPIVAVPLAFEVDDVADTANLATY
jgi:hypothetical protein